MGFLDKVKNVLGIGGVKIQLDVPKEAKKDDGKIKGSVALTSKSDQHIIKVEVKLVEDWSIGRGEQKTEKQFTLGEEVISGECDIKSGETKTFDFAIPFSMILSKNDKMKNQGGVVGKLGSAGSFLDGERSVYSVSATADVKGVLLIPTKSTNILLK